VAHRHPSLTGYLMVARDFCFLMCVVRACAVCVLCMCVCVCVCVCLLPTDVAVYTLLYVTNFSLVYVVHVLVVKHWYFQSQNELL